MHSGLSRADRKGGRTTGARADKPTTSWKVRQIVRQATTITHVLFFFFQLVRDPFLFYLDLGTRSGTSWICLVHLISGYWSSTWVFPLLASRVSFLGFKNTGLEDGTDLDSAWSGTGGGIAIGTWITGKRADSYVDRNTRPLWISHDGRRCLACNVIAEWVLATVPT